MPGLDFSFLLGGNRPRDDRRAEEDPFRIVVLGDFRGGSDAPTATAATPIDLDTFDDVFARCQPRAVLAFGQKSTELAFADFDDFHPDALLQRMPTLAACREQALALRDPTRAAAMLGRLGASPAPTAPAASPPPPAGASPFEQLLGQPRDAARAPTGLDGWLANLVRPHLAASVDPRAMDLAATIDQATAALLREVLHHPEFQAREAAWRGLRWLLQRIECDETLQVSLLDVSARTLADATRGDDLRSSPLHRALCERAGAGSQPFALAIVLLPFAANQTDLRSLAVLGALGELGGFPVVATGGSSLLGIPAWPEAGDPTTWHPPAVVAEAWRALRLSRQARRLALVAPRFLLRLPYGPATDPIDAFRFEEHLATSSHEHYLWGASGLAVAMLLGNAFRDDGWRLDASGHHEVAELPLHTRKVDGKVVMQPCAETLLAARAVDALTGHGFSVLQSYANRDAARLVRLRSLAPGDADLVGAWNS